MGKHFILGIVAAMLLLPLTLRADYTSTFYFNTQKAGKVPFSHDVHLKRLDNNCSSCHNAVFHIVPTKNPTYTMADMEKGKSCGSCHNKDNPRTPQLSSCTTCHPAGDIPIRILDFGNVVFSHGKHLGVYTCSDCHDKIFRTTRDNPHFSMAQMAQGKSCGACHDGSTAFSVKGDCVKCHAVRDMALPGDSIFSHKLHLDMSFACAECHNKLFIPGPNRISRTMEDMEKGQGCGACHDGKTAFSVKGDCQKCHKSVKEISFKAHDARFSHVAHTALFKCGECHSGIFIGGPRSIRYSMTQMEQGKSCGTCHDGKTAFGVSSSCNKCHPGAQPDITFTIKDAGTVSFSHNKHRQVTNGCGDCHNGVFTTGSAAKRFTMAEMSKGKSCGACHNGKMAFNVDSKSCDKCHPVKEMLFADDARFNHVKHLSAYSCYDCHSQIYKAGPDNKRYTMAEMEQGKSCGVCHDGSTMFSVKGDCNKCHHSTINVAFNVRETGTTYFSHQFHTAAFKCTDCHNAIYVAGKGSKRYKMADMEKGQSCGTCHDGKTAFGVKDTCTKCHPVRQITFKPGSATFSHQVHVSVYGCKDCHPSLYLPGKGNKHVSMAMMEKGHSCGSCHDGSTAFSVKGSCQKCHPGTPRSVRYELSQTTGNVEFNHKVHGDKGYQCVDCHYNVVPSGTADKRWVMKEMDQGKFCGTCHGFSMAFSVKDPQACERCHQRESDWRPPLSQ